MSLATALVAENGGEAGVRSSRVAMPWSGPPAAANNAQRPPFDLARWGDRNVDEKLMRCERPTWLLTREKRTATGPILVMTSAGRFAVWQASAGIPLKK